LFWSVSGDASDDVWAVGQDGIARWNGTRWHIVGGTPKGDGGPFAIEAIAPNDVWVVGTHYVHTAADLIIQHTFTEHWNGTSWTIVPSPNRGTPIANGRLTAVTAVGHDDVWAVGTWGKGAFDRTLVMHWNGVRWSIKRSPNPEVYGILNAVGGVVGTRHLWAVGYKSAGVIGVTDTFVLYHAG
jgi:hypothetical protein